MVRDTGISIHLMLLFISGAQEISQLYYNFNTSHVTVYRIFPVGSSNMFKFQYISCYCLSTCPCGMETDWYISIHLMLLFIEKLDNGEVLSKDFNTSHVTVYRNLEERTKRRRSISIHLMLLFISRLETTAELWIIISIHLMLLFI